MARLGGRVQLEQSDMCVALNMAKMAKEGFSRATREETKYLIKKPSAEVREEKKWGVEFPGHKQVEAAIQRHPAMLCQNPMSGSHPRQDSTARNPQTRWRCEGTGAPPPVRRREPTPEPTPSPPSAPPTPTGNTFGAQPSEIVSLQAGYTYSHTALPCTESFHDHEDSQHNTDFDPDMLTDEGYYTICCVVMRLTSILKTRAADWVIRQLMTSMDRKTQDFGYYYYTYLCLIKEQYSDQEESKWKRQKGSQNIVNDGLCQIKWLHIVDTAMAKWASMECQRLLVMRPEKSHLR